MKRNKGTQVSVRGSSFDAVQGYCTKHKTGTTVAAQVNLWIAEHFEQGADDSAVLSPEQVAEAEEHFTF